ncbi:putative phospholipase c [Malassezia pachydermatis]|uniref:Putative phospholipase c n=1 Tax=Malassezia pachydermatis TaxID=77020 RepID=A0A0M8MTS3_9BASI|nr:putative phospholipase c [Malassezia pachydermatis]KOS14184.1 putative phospholipase c [Malassezia pachydermatis]
MTYQDFDNFCEDRLFAWEQYQAAAAKHTAFANASVSVAHALMTGKNWNQTAMFVSYDETGGWADHVMAPHAPKDTPGEWIQDPFDTSLGLQPTGPGFRVPFYIVLPFTRNGGVFTEHAAHESQILFLEEWSKAIGKSFQSKEMNLKYRNKIQPEIPYGKQNESDALYVEHGYKKVRGHLTEGRYLRFEAWSHALSVNSSSLSSTGHSDKFARDALFVLHWPGSQPKDNQFWILNQSKDKFLTSDLSFSGSDHAATFARVDHTDGKGHSMNSEKIDLAKPGWFL